MRHVLFFLCLSVLLGCNALTAHAQQSAQPLSIGFLPGAASLDSPFNALTYLGLARAQEDFELELRAREALGPVWNQDEARAQLDSLLRQHVHAVVLNGNEWGVAVRELAPAFPAVRFILTEALVEDLPNVVSLRFANEQGGFLAGCLAGLLAAPGKAAFIGGADIPPLRDLAAGFAQGLAHVAPGTQGTIAWLGTGQDFSGFASPDKGRAKAQELYEQGVEIIFAAAGGGGDGVLIAASEQGRLVIGMDYDQSDAAPGHVPASLLKRMDLAVYQELQFLVRGTFTPGVHVYDLRDGGLELTGLVGPNTLIPAGVQEKVLEAAEKVRAGLIVVQPAPAVN